MSKKLAMFPMTRTQCTIARYSCILCGYTISHTLVPGFMYLQGMDISHLDGGSNAGILLSDFDKRAVEECDVLFVDYDETLSDLSLYWSVIRIAENLNKSIIYSNSMSQRLERMTTPTDANYNKSDADFLIDIRIPVITVMSQGCHTDQLAVELALRNHFINAGYNASQIGSSDVAHIFGYTEMPGFLYHTLDAYDKILLFNSFVSALVEKEQPEVLIIGISESIMKYNDRILHGLGIVPYIVSQGIRIDFPIVCVPHNMYKVEFFNELDRYCQYHLRTADALRMINVSNTSTIMDKDSDVKLNHIDLNSGYVLSKIAEMEHGDFNLFNALDHESMLKACETVQVILTENVGVVQ